MATGIGTSIKRARERKRWSQRQLASALGVDRKTVDNWENGRTMPRSSIGALEEVLGVSLDGPESEESELPTSAELEDLHAHIREVLGDDAGPVSEALDAAVTGAPLRRAGAASARLSDRRRAAGAS